MKRSIVLFVLGAVAHAGLTGWASGQIIQLKGGTVLVGKVDAHEDGLTFMRLDNGGVLDLRWDQLSDESAGKIKAMFNLSVEDESEVMVTADVIEYESSVGQREQIVGRIIADDETTISVRRKGMVFPIRRRSIKRRANLEVPATDIYTVGQFYNEKLNEFAPGEDADKHIKLADLLVRVRDYEHAGEHLQKAKELGGGKQQNTLAGRIDSLKRFSGAKAEREHLDSIRTLMARKQFSKGVEKIVEFEQKYPDTKLAGDFARIKKHFGKTRERFLISRVTELWYKNLWALARVEAPKPELTFTAAKDYAESQMGQDIRERLQKALKLPVEEIEELWERRLTRRSGPRPERYHYGIGSWALGAEAIMKGTRQGSAESKPTKSKKDKDMERILKRIRKAQERAKRALAKRGGARGKKEDVTPEDWWDDASANERIGWLRAYYAEYGGDLEVKGQFLEDCARCGGDGHFIVFRETGHSQKEKCTTCQGTRYKRWFRAR